MNPFVRGRSALSAVMDRTDFSPRAEERFASPREHGIVTKLGLRFGVRFATGEGRSARYDEDKRG